MKGSLIVVLNKPVSDDELALFSRAVFGFATEVLVVVSNDFLFKHTLEKLNKEAYEKGRSFLKVSDSKDAEELFAPDFVFYVSTKKTGRLETKKISDALLTEKTVMIVFGSEPEGRYETLQLNGEVYTPFAVSIVLYRIHEAMLPIQTPES